MERTTKRKTITRNELVKKLDPDSIWVGKQLGYPVRIHKMPIGYGTSAEVLEMKRKGIDEAQERKSWALKKVKKGAANFSLYTQRLLSEASVLRQLNHDHVIGYRKLIAMQDKSVMLAMELVESSLSSLIEERQMEELGAFLPGPIRGVGLGIASALDYLHNKQSLMHGDVKSSNVLIAGRSDDDVLHPKLCDFGVAVPITKEGLMKPGFCYIGTGPWIAPEVKARDPVITTAAEIFSYGLVVWEMMSLQFPHVNAIEDADDFDSDEDSDDSDQDSGYLTGSKESVSYRELVGTRPILPELPKELDYSKILSVFHSATETLPSARPSASQLITLWSNSL